MGDKWIELAKLASGCCGCGCCCHSNYHDLAAKLLRDLGYTHYKLDPADSYTPTEWKKPKEAKHGSD